ncbi:dihydrolipoamide dehydrogenase, partial [mine drainage metagenome]
MAGTYARATEVLVVGAGPAGYMAALRLGQLGKKVLLVERQELGGECLNRGCIPSKALIHASRLYAQVTQEGAEIGVSATGVGFDMAQTQRWKTEVVAKERQGVQTLLKGAGVTVLKGVARFTGPRSAQFTAPDGGSERIDFTDAVIATGAVPVTLPGFETDGRRVVNAWELLGLDRLPKSLIVLGGGVSGCELGQFMARVGVQVTIVELMPQLLPGLEVDLARELTRCLERSGVSVRTGTRATRLDRSGATLKLDVEGAQG